MNTNILKGLFAILAISAVFGVFVNQSFALPSNVEEEITQMGADSPIKTPGEVTAVLKAVLRWTYVIFFIVAVYFILLAAFNYLTAGGDPAKIKTAHSSLLWSLVAIAVGLISVGAAQIIESFLKAR